MSVSNSNLFRPRTRPVQQIAEPGRFWIAHVPRIWRSSSRPWTNLARAGIAGLDRRLAPLPDFDYSDLDDLLYLPPVSPALASERDLLMAEILEAGTPVLLQLRLAEEPPELPAGGGAVIYDLVETLLAGDVDQLYNLPRGSAAVWPLIAGLTDTPEMWDEGCNVLALAGAVCVQPLALELSPYDRRRLAEGRGDHVFDALFHGPAPAERDFSRVAARHGLRPFVSRPPTGHLRRQRRNRHLAAQLALIGELHLRLGRSVSYGQAVFRAARGCEQTQHDLTALVHENNLKVMTWISAPSRELITQLVREGTAPILNELLEAYLGCTLS